MQTMASKPATQTAHASHKHVPPRIEAGSILAPIPLNS
jgi:hypothetical protein